MNVTEKINHHRTWLIEQGIAIDAAKGAANAWAFLLHHAIPREIIPLVLVESASRRRHPTPPA